MNGKKNTTSIVVGIVFLVIGIVVGLLFSNMYSTGNAKNVLSNNVYKVSDMIDFTSSNDDPVIQAYVLKANGITVILMSSNEDFFSQKTNGGTLFEGGDRLVLIHRSGNVEIINGNLY